MYILWEKCNLLRKTHICHSLLLFSSRYPVFSRVPVFLFSRSFGWEWELDSEAMCGNGRGRLVDHRCRSVQSIHLCKATLVDGATVTNSCLSPIGIRIMNSRDKVNSHVFGANWQIATSRRRYSHGALRIWFVWLFVDGEIYICI